MVSLVSDPTSTPIEAQILVMFDVFKVPLLCEAVPAALDGLLLTDLEHVHGKLGPLFFHLSLDVHVIFERAFGDVSDQARPVIEVDLLWLVRIRSHILPVDAGKGKVVDYHVEVAFFLDQNVGALADDFADTRFHLLRALGIDAVLAVHVAAL